VRIRIDIEWNITVLVSCFVVARILVFLKVSETHLRIECPGGLVNLHKGKSFLVDERLVRSYQTNLQRRWEDCYVKEGCVNTGGGGNEQIDFFEILLRRRRTKRGAFLMEQAGGERAGRIEWVILVIFFNFVLIL